MACVRRVTITHGSGTKAESAHRRSSGRNKMRGASSTSSATFGSGLQTAGTKTTLAHRGAETHLPVIPVIALGAEPGTWTHFAVGRPIAATIGMMLGPAGPGFG